MRELIEHGAHINEQCNAGWTPLHKACLKGYVEIVQLLCQSGAKLDVQSTEERDTPLHDACSNGHKEVVEVLLTHGANPTLSNSEGLFPHEMVDDGYPDVKQIVLDAQRAWKETHRESNDNDREDSEPPVSPATKRHSRRTSTASDVPLQSNFPGNGRPRRGAPAAKDDFLARDIHYRDPFRRSHLHLQALQGNGQFVRELLEMGASYSGRDRDGNTPLHLAARGGHSESVQALLEYCADVNALNKQGETPLHEAAGRGHKDTLQMLLFYGADRSLRDNRAWTAYDVARESVNTAAEGELEMLMESSDDIDDPHQIEREATVKLEEPDELLEIAGALEPEDQEDPEPEEKETIAMSVSPPPPPPPRMSPPMEGLDLPTDSFEISPISPVDAEVSKIAEVHVLTPSSVEGSSPHLATEEGEEEESPLEKMEIDEQETEVSLMPAIESKADLPSEGIDLNVKDTPEAYDDEILPKAESLSPEPFECNIDEHTSKQESVTPLEVHEGTVEGAFETAISPPPCAAGGMVEVHVADERQTLTPPPEPRWAKLASLESLPEDVIKELSYLLPIYTMQFRNCSADDRIYVAHTQVCTLLGFTSQELFDKCNPIIVTQIDHSLDPYIIKRALSNREKLRVSTNFVSLVSYPLTRLTHSELEALMHSDPTHPELTADGDLWHKFSAQRKHQFMAMSVYLVPLDQLREIIAADFPAFKDLLIDRNLRKLDTSDLDGDEGIVYCDQEADQYIDCWRRFAEKYASCGL